MTNQNNNKDNLPRPLQRMLAFLGPRTARPTKRASDATGVSSRGSRNVAEMQAEALSPAEYRLQQQQLFRQRQLEYNESLMGRPQGRRDAVVPGKLNWLPIGPAGVERGQADTTPVVSGRTKGIAIAPGGTRAYIASVGGGVWYTHDQGKNWKPLMDPIDYFTTDFNALTRRADSLSCGAIALVPGSSQADDKIYVGTGEPGINMDVMMGVGPLMSSNGGLTWTRETASPTLVNHGFYAMVVDPDDPERVVAGTDIGVFIRDPGGTHIWNQQANLAGNWVSSLVVAKGKGRKMFFAAVWGWGGPSGVFSSPDGVNWSPLGNALPNAAQAGRITLAVHPNNPDIVYALVSGATQFAADGVTVVANQGYLHGAYRLNQAVDNQWRPITGFPADIFGGKPIAQGGQGWYDNTIVVAPDNENLIYVGGSGITFNGAFSSTINRCLVTVTGSGAAQTLGTVPDYIGNSVHADVHGLVFAPNNPHELWACCDGGVFFTNRAKELGDIFVSKNKGLQTLTINYLGTHPTEEEVLFCGVQDNGGLRYIGEKIWLHSMPGDGGYYIVNGASPFTVLTTYNNNFGRYSTIGGNRPAGNGYTATGYSVPLTPASAGPPVVAAEDVLFYAPLAQVPFAPGQSATQANILAFGTERPWISVDFGVNWLPLPSRTPNNAAQLQADRTNVGGGHVTALAFADSQNLLIGMASGRIFKYTDTSGAPNNWSAVNAPSVPLSNGGGLPGVLVTDFAVVPGNPNQFYVAFGGAIGGANGHQHVWFYDGTTWHDRSGSGTDKLLDVHFNAIAIDPNSANHLYAGSDVGVWRSEDGGNTWKPFSYGLPETAIIDLKFSTRSVGGNMITLLRAATYGRGVYECDLSNAITPDVSLYLRDTVLDRARYPARIGATLSDPRNSANKISDIDTPDIKLDAPDTNGLLQAVSLHGQMTSGEFYLDLQDKSSAIPVPSAGVAVSKVHVQVHNQGILNADNVRVMLLLHDGAATLPALPAAYKNKVTAGIPIEEGGWKTLGIRHLHGVSAGRPGIATFDLSSAVLGAVPPAGKDFVLVALAHHPLDPYQSDATVLDTGTAAGNVVLSNEYKITFKKIKAVQQNVPPPPVVQALPLADFVAIPDTATVPGAPYDAFLAFAYRQNDALIERTLQGSLAALFASRGNETPAANPDPKTVLFADNITVNTMVQAEPGIPVVWYARQKISISGTINAKEKGAAAADTGDFGGAGGGGNGNAGKNCHLPRSTPAIVIATGGAAGNNVGGNLNAVWASRAPLMLPFSKGGAAGGPDAANPGGLGGGIVVLCAPVIEFLDNGIIDASGGDGAANAGGGGGGLILLIAREIIGLRDGGATPNVLYGGGGSSGSGGRGGNGLLLRKEIA